MTTRGSSTPAFARQAATRYRQPRGRAPAKPIDHGGAHVLHPLRSMRRGYVQPTAAQFGGAGLSRMYLQAIVAAEIEHALAADELARRGRRVVGLPHRDRKRGRGCRHRSRWTAPPFLDQRLQPLAQRLVEGGILLHVDADFVADGVLHLAGLRLVGGQRPDLLLELRREERYFLDQNLDAVRHDRVRDQLAHLLPAAG